jgi:ABC-2 type transport system permease protein
MRECHRFIRLANQTLVPPIITVVLFILIFGYALGSRISSIQGVSYMQFLIPGLVMMTVINSAYSNTSSSLYIARFQGSIQELLVSSMSNLETVLAFILGGVLRGLCVGAIVIVIATFLADITIVHVGATFFFILVVAFIFSCAGFITALWAEDFDRLSLFQNYVLTPLTYLGGVFFSVDNLPPVWKAVAMANPILYFVNGLRFGFLGITDVPLAAATVICLFVATGAFVLCFLLYRAGYNLKT